MFRQVVFFLRDCLAFEAGCLFEEGETANRRGVDEIDIAALKPQAPAIVRHVRRLLSEDRSAKSPVKKYFDMVESLVRQDGAAECIYALTELVAADDKADIGKEVAENLDWIRDKFLFSARDPVRESAAQLLAILLAVSDSKVFSSQVETLLTAVTTANVNYEKMSGGLLALGAVLGRRSMTADAKGNWLVEDLEMSSSNDAGDLATRALDLIKTNTQHSNVLVQTSALSSLVELSRFMALPLNDGEFPDDKENEEKPSSPCEDPSTKASLAKLLLNFVSSSKHPAKVREKAALAAAALCCGVGRCDGVEGSLPPFAHAKKVLEGLLESSKVKELELHFHVGAALSTAALGPGSRLARDSWTVDFDALDRDAREATVSAENLEFLVDKLTTKYLSHENKHVKQAATVWTLALVQEAGGLKLVQGKMAKLQDKLLRLLFVEDEITQELSAKSLCLCYSFSTEESRKDLVSNLCDTLVGGETTRDAKEGSPPDATSPTSNGDASSASKESTPSDAAATASSTTAVNSTAFFNVGTKASAYRELAAIAIELNQPDLVYKFIFLAHKNSSLKTPGAATLMSKRRHAEIAVEASEQLLPHKKTILPKLYRYLHDPDVKIQTAMTAIWRCLVPSDANAVVDEYLKDIVDELLREIENRGSVVREACCHAMTEALRGRALNPIVVGKLGELWRVVLARLDDVKETVRKAAIPLARMLSHASILACDTNNGKLGASAIDATLPVLLKEGFMSTNVAEIRALVLDTLQKLTKQTGALLKPHLPLLMPALLESISGLESSSMNYLSLRLAGSNREDVLEKLDEARLSASKASPMMETLKFCIQYVDDDVMQKLAPSIIDVLKSGVGMSTKASAGELLVAFIFQIPQVVAPFAPKFMSSLLNGLADRQAGVRRSYSTAIGYVAKVASAKSMDKSIGKLQTWYLEKPPEERTLRRAIAWVFGAISKHALDQLKAHASAALPLVFFASHAPAEEGEEPAQGEAAIWSEVWTEVTPGMEQGIHLYLKEIIALLQIAIVSPSWPLKSQAARAIGTIAQNLPPEKMDAENLKNLLTAVAVEGLAGRTWEGKEALLEATSALCCRNSASFKSSSMEVDLTDSQKSLLALRPTLLSILTREAKKEKLSYKISAIDAAARVFEAWSADDQFQALATTTLERLVKDEVDDAVETSMDHDGIGHHQKPKSPERVTFEETALESLGRAFPDHLPSDPESLAKTRSSVDALAERMGEKHVWKIQLAALKGMYLVVKKTWVLGGGESGDDGQSSTEVESFLKRVVGPIRFNLGNKKYVAIRKCAVDILDKIFESESCRKKFGETLKTFQKPLTDMSSDVNIELQKKSGELLKLIT